MLNKININHQKQILIIYIVLAVVTLAVFWQVNQYDFVYIDDETYVIENSHIKSGITLEGIRWAFGSTYLVMWHPLVWLSFMFDYQLYGLNPSGYHVTNLVLHILSTLLLFWFFNRMTGTIWKSAFVAAFFAIHPLHVESVVWISERKDVLSAFFWMLTLCLYVYYTEKPAIKRYLLVLFSFVLALLSKPVVVTLPLIMILLDYWPLRRFELKKDNWVLWQLKEKIPFMVLSTVHTILTSYSFFNTHPYKIFPLEILIANIPIAFVTYLSQTFWPHNMAFYYPFPAQITIWQVVGATLLIIAVSIAFFTIAKRLPCLFVGWMWYTVSILPAMEIVLAGYYAVADRYHYLPSIGIAIMLAWGIPLLFQRESTRKKILFPAAIAFLAFLTFLTWKQCGYWKNTIEISKHALQTTKNNFVAHKCLADALFAEGKVEEAIYHYNEAIRIYPAFVNAHINRANAYYKLGRYQEAFEDLSDTIRLTPDCAIAWGHRGNLLNHLKQNQRAVEDLSEAIRLKPDYVDAYNNRGNTYNNLGQYQRAVDDLSKAISIKPDTASFYYNRASSYINLGQYQKAIEDYNKTISLDPAYFDAYNNRGFIYLNLGQHQKAFEDYSKAIQLKPDYANAFNNRAFVYLITGHIESGCSDAQKACKLGVCATLETAKVKGYCH